MGDGPPKLPENHVKVRVKLNNHQRHDGVYDVAKMHGGKSYLTHSGSERDGGAISSERYEVHVPHDKKDQFVKDLHKRLSEEDEDGGYFSESRDDDIDCYHSIKAKGVHLET